jgi:hypothetical protein
VALAQVRVGLANVLKRADLRLRLSCPPVRDGTSLGYGTSGHAEEQHPGLCTWQLQST